MEANKNARLVTAVYCSADFHFGPMPLRPELFSIARIGVLSSPYRLPNTVLEYMAAG